MSTCWPNMQCAVISPQSRLTIKKILLWNVLQTILFGVQLDISYIICEIKSDYFIWCILSDIWYSVLCTCFICYLLPVIFYLILISTCCLIPSSLILVIWKLILLVKKNASFRSCSATCSCNFYFLGQGLWEYFIILIFLENCNPPWVFKIPIFPF